MTSSASRFYQRSHEINRAAAIPAALDGAPQTLALLARPQHRYHCVYRYLRQNPGREIVELGFGNPAIPAALAGMCASYHIVDIVDRRDQAALPANLAFTAADLNEDFPFADASFDDAVAMMVVEHLFDPFHSFRELARITRPGGRVLVNLPNVASIKCRAQLLAGRMPVTSSADWFQKREWDGNHLHYFTIADTLRLAAQAGLAIEHVFPVGHHLALKRLWPELLCHEISFQFQRR